MTAATGKPRDIRNLLPDVPPFRLDAILCECEPIVCMMVNDGCGFTLLLLSLLPPTAHTVPVKLLGRRILNFDVQNEQI